MPGPQTRRKTRRKHGAADLVMLQGRVPEDVRESYHAAANLTGVSLAYYLEKLAQYLNENDAWPAVPKPLPRAETLDLDSLEANTAAA